MLVYQSVDIPIPKREIAGIVSTHPLDYIYIYGWWFQPL